MSAGVGTPIGSRPTYTGTVEVGRVDALGDGSNAVASGAKAGPSPVPGVVAARHPHVWVQDDEVAGQEWPGLVIEQGRDADGAWLAHVVMVVTLGGAARTTVSGWVPAAAVRPAHPEPRSSP